MRKITILFGAVLALAIPSAAQAHHGGPSKADHAAAVKACRAERGTTDASKAAFAQKYGTNGNKRNAFGKCVSQQAKAKHQARVRRQDQQGSGTQNQQGSGTQGNKRDDDQGDDNDDQGDKNDQADDNDDQGDDDSQHP